MLVRLAVHNFDCPSAELVRLLNFIVKFEAKKAVTSSYDTMLFRIRNTMQSGLLPKYQNWESSLESSS